MKKITYVLASCLFLFVSCGGNDDKKEEGDEEEMAITAETLPDEYKENIADFCDCMAKANKDPMAEMKCLDLSMEFTKKNGLDKQSEKSIKYRVYFDEIAKCSY